MKKIFMGVTATLLSLMLLISAGGCTGCSGCSSSSPLSFKNSFIANKTPEADYEETLVYTVKNVEEYDGGYLNVSPSIKEVIDSFSYEGTYTVKLTTTTSGNEELRAEVSQNNVVKNLTNDGNTGCIIIKIESTLEYTSTFTINGVTEEESNNYVKKVVYTCDKNHSFAPLYSTTESLETIVEINNGTASTKRTEYKDSIVYDISSYKIKKTANGKSAEKDVPYSLRYLVDNNQLLFAIRNLPLANEQSQVLPTASAVYEQTKDLVIRNENEYQETISIDFNGNKISQEIPVRKMSFVLDNGSLSGSKQFLVLQNGEVKDGEQTLINDLSLPVEYASMLCSYGTFARMGAIVFKLSSVTINAL